MSTGLTTSVTLEFGAEIDGAQVGVLQMRRPRVRDLLTADKGSTGAIEREIKLFANLCEVAPSVIEDLYKSDYGRLQDAYADFDSGAPAART